jgi:uncharacterized membrane protein
MTLRGPKERLLQTLAYEAGGLALVTPINASLFAVGTGESAALLLMLSIAVLVWTPIHNTIFDAVEWRLLARVASDRPTHWRLLHAISLEATSMIVTLPLLLLMGGLTLAEAVLADVGLTIFYAAYAYVFHLIYDRLRPVVRPRKTQ